MSVPELARDRQWPLGRYIAIQNYWRGYAGQAQRSGEIGSFPVTMWDPGDETAMLACRADPVLGGALSSSRRRIDPSEP